MTQEVISITPEVARRYLLGVKGLWPGRRFNAKAGARDAIRMLESVQVDPMTVVARSHDLSLWSRVRGYDPEQLNELLYVDREFFDYGGNLNVYPMAEMPYWRLHMQRRRLDERQVSFVTEHADLIAAVRTEIETSGPLGNRDFAGGERVDNYRGRKATGLALYHLWLTGDLVSHSRKGFERQYDLRERVIPERYGWQADEQESEQFFAHKSLRAVGLGTMRDWSNTWAYFMHRRPDRDEVRETLDQLLSDGHAAAIRIDGRKGSYYAPATALPHIAQLQAGTVPTEWQVLDTTTETEVTFLSPLDKLLNRARTKTLFDFEYIWEVYKPVKLRRWGYYTMPILYGDRLVGRLDPKLDRKSGTLSINGFWLENDTLALDSAFADALDRGLQSFARFHDARLETGGVSLPAV